MKKSIIVIILLFCFTTVGRGQGSVKDTSIALFMLSPTFAYHVPGGDLANRFGNNLSIGLSFSYKMKSNWLIGIEGDFIFGPDVIENSIFDGITTHDGYFIGVGGTFADIRTYERGYHLNLKVGKLIPIWSQKKNSGPLFTLGVGFLSHKIRIENPSNDFPQLQDDYLDGYDRLTNGFALTEFAGYQYLSNNARINFFAGFEFIQGFTQNKRAMNFNTMTQDDTKRFDLLSGIRVGWIFAIYKHPPREAYYN